MGKLCKILFVSLYLFCSINLCFNLKKKFTSLAIELEAQQIRNLWLNKNQIDADGKLSVKPGDIDESAFNKKLDMLKDLYNLNGLQNVP